MPDYEHLIPGLVYVITTPQGTTGGYASQSAGGQIALFDLQGNPSGQISEAQFFAAREQGYSLGHVFSSAGPGEAVSQPSSGQASAPTTRLPAPTTGSGLVAPATPPSGGTSPVGPTTGTQGGPLIPAGIQAQVTMNGRTYSVRSEEGDVVFFYDGNTQVGTMRSSQFLADFRSGRIQVLDQGLRIKVSHEISD